MSGPNNGRLVLLLIAGIPVTMILAATWLWLFVARGDLDIVGLLGTANRGELVQPPRPLAEVTLRDRAGVALPFEQLEPRWTLLVPGGATCGEDCEQLLYLTRQIHVAIGKDFNRLRRAHAGTADPGRTRLAVDALSDDSPVPESFGALLEGEHRGLLALHLQAADFDRLFPEWRADRSTWYLVDPRGWVMMAYNSEIPYKDVISDLKFLLKNSGT